jgi:hypothetical protein
MNVKSRKLLLASLTGLLLVSACGGSSDDGAGQLSSFQASGDISFGTGTNDCPAGDKVGDVSVIGGTAPYRVLNPSNTFIAFGPGLSTTVPAFPGSNYTISNRNGQVAVFAFSCFEGDITVLDDLGRVATFSVTAASGTGS